MKKTLLTLSALALLGSHAFADIVYITARPTPSGAGANPNGSYTELIAGSDTSAKSAVVDAPTRDGERFWSGTTFSNSQFSGSAFLRLTPTLAVPGAVYQVDHTFSSTANNTTLDALVRMSNAAGCTLSWTNTDKFRRPFGQPAPQQWQLLGYLTNDPGSSTPTIETYLVSITNANSTTARFPVDTFRFTLAQPCLAVPVVGVTGPLSSNVNQVVVTGVSATATNVNVYQDSGAGMVLIGSKTSGVTVSNNTVTVSGLIKGAQVAATQKINGQEGCVPTAGILVGGGANPRVRIALSIRETSSTGPIGTAGISTNANIHFLGASGTSGGAPIDGLVVNPAAGWQTVTFDRGTITIAAAANVAGAVADGPGYNANDIVRLRVYAYQTGPANGIVFYSPTPGQSAVVTSNDTFTVNWTWNAVAGAEGYRLLREVNGNGYTNDFFDVTGVNNFSDANNAWSPGLAAVTPTSSQTNASIQWNPTVGNGTNFPTDWAILEGLALTIDDTTDTGPYDLYIDNLKNGTTTWQTFEGSVAGTAEVSFRAPSFSGTTSANILSAPDQSVVSNGAADAGTKSLRVRFQWSNTNTTRWLRLTTSGVGNPQVKMDQPISFRMLLLPVNATPVAPAAPTLTINQLGTNQVLTWTDAHRLQAATLVTGTYTNLPGITTAPWTNNLAEPQKFFRLAD